MNDRYLYEWKGYTTVSSEEGYDFLTFSIDNKELGNWSGEADWAMVEFEVESGLHNFKWEYVKDVSSKEGDDRAYIDFVQFPPLLVFKVDVEEVVEDNNVTVYPNPTKKWMIVEILDEKLINLIETEKFEVQLLSAQGKILKKENLQRKILKIDLDNYQSGVYFICLMDKKGQRRTTQKLIIQ